jgi:hypothetical protein
VPTAGRQRVLVAQCWSEERRHTVSPDRLVRQCAAPGLGAKSIEGCLRVEARRFVRRVSASGVRTRARSAEGAHCVVIQCHVAFLRFVAGRLVAVTGSDTGIGSDLEGEQSPWKDRRLGRRQRWSSTTDSSVEQGHEVSQHRGKQLNFGRVLPKVQVRASRRAHCFGSCPRCAESTQQPTPEYGASRRSGVDHSSQ